VVLPSRPLATCVEVVLNATAPPHTPVPPPPFTVAEVHFTVTAETGTVAHPTNVLALAAAFSVQVLALFPLEACHVTEVAGPATVSRSGSVATNVIDVGFTARLETVASGLIETLAGPAVVCPLTVLEPAGPAPNSAATIHAVNIRAYAALMV
jgi:hypothetical protein